MVSGEQQLGEGGEGKDIETSVSVSEAKVKGLWKTATVKACELNSNQDELIEMQPSKGNIKSSKQDNPHKVWKPSQMADVVIALRDSLEQDPKLPPQKSPPKVSLRSRQQVLQDRIQATQAVLPDEILKVGEEEAKPERQFSLKEASKCIIINNRRVSDVVSQYLAKMRVRAEARTDVASSNMGIGKDITSVSYTHLTLPTMYCV